MSSTHSKNEETLAVILEEINKKLILALKYNIKPIVCIGSNESLENEINMILKDIKKESINN